MVILYYSDLVSFKWGYIMKKSLIILLVASFLSNIAYGMRTYGSFCTMNEVSFRIIEQIKNMDRAMIERLANIDNSVSTLSRRIMDAELLLRGLEQVNNPGATIRRFGVPPRDLFGALNGVVSFSQQAYGTDAIINNIDIAPAHNYVSADRHIVQDSINAALRVVHVNPNDVQARLDLGDLYYQSGKYKRALKHYDAAYRITPDSIEILRRCGQAHRQLGELADAQEMYEKALDLDENNISIMNALVDCYIGDNQEAAEEILNRVLAIDENNIDALNYFADLYYLDNDHQEARKCIDRVLAIDPNNERAKEILDEMNAYENNSEDSDDSEATQEKSFLDQSSPIIHLQNKHNSNDNSDDGNNNLHTPSVSPIVNKRLLSDVSYGSTNSTSAAVVVKKSKLDSVVNQPSVHVVNQPTVAAQDGDDEELLDKVLNDLLLNDSSVNN